MSDHKLEEVETKGHPALDMPSILDAIKQDQSELAKQKDVYIPVAGYEKTGLAIKYGLPDSGKDLDRIATKVMRETKDNYLRNLHIAIDTMLKLNQGLYVMPPGVEDYVELDPENVGSPIELNDRDRLTEVFGWEASTGRDAVKKLFGDKELPILTHAEKLNRWLQNTNADLDTELWRLGE